LLNFYRAKKPTNIAYPISATKLPYIIPIAFINIFPQQGNGFPGDNLGYQWWGSPHVYPDPPGNPSQLQSDSPQITAGGRSLLMRSCRLVVYQSMKTGSKIKIKLLKNNKMREQRYS
jgi:hypothetical protein